METDYVPPQFKCDAFNCPACGAFAHQRWLPVGYASGKGMTVISTHQLSRCSRCAIFAVCVDEILYFPGVTTAPRARPVLPEDIKTDFEEARSIVAKSPRGAAALLRLAVQKLCVHLGEPGKDLNSDIASLVKKGLSERVQKALDIVRVIGNEAVHPGQIDLRDDQEMAGKLFKLVNIIVEKMIAEPQEIEELFGGLPDSKRKQIEARDKKA